MRRLLPLFAIFLVLAALPARAANGPATILIDVETGKVLSSSQSDALWYPASLTKMMTAYVTFQALKDDKLKPTSAVKVSAHALAQAPSKMGFKVGTILNVDNALKMMLVKSANDIAVAVAETVGGNETKFAAKMNSAAVSLGMASTHYDNANGLPDSGQITTARDLAVLARAILIEFPQYREYFGIPRHQGREAHTAVAERAAGALSRHDRDEDRVHLFVRVQHRCLRQARRADAGRGRARCGVGDGAE